MATIPNDPLFATQWHLQNTTMGQFDLNVVDVWDDYTGAGIRVAVFDDGFDLAHTDLDGNVDTVNDFDYIDNDFDPTAGPSDNQGTAVMGIIGAEEGNSLGGVGVAWDAGLVGYRGYAMDGVNAAAQILDAAGLGDGIGNTNGNANGADVINVSSSFGDNVFFTSADNTAALNALETISANGRGGLGTLYVKASGDARADAGSSTRGEGTAEALDSSNHSISVGAVRQDGWVTDSSTPGANLLVTAFADDTSNASAIVTTDRTGADGFDAGDFTSTFGGTEAAAAQVSGVVALMLEANGQLGWRDVQMILAASARHVGSDVGTAANTGAPASGGFEQVTQLDGSSWFFNGADNWNGGGMHFSNDYGYGLVDAKAAVRLAETWELQSTSANDFRTFEDDVNTTTTFDNATETFTINEVTDILIEHVSLEVAFETTYLGDVNFYLTSPDGTRVQLIADTGNTADFNGRWEFGTTAFMGETSAGNWTFTAADDAGGDPLTITDADLRTFGSVITNDDLFIVTNEFSDYAALSSHSTSFAGGAGINTFNAAAVDSASTIDLDANTGTVDGVAIDLTNIQKVFTGDGNDTVIGDSVTTLISTGRGDDGIVASLSADYLDAGAGTDTLDLSNLTDSVWFDMNNDELYIGPNAQMGIGVRQDALNFENVIGTGFDDLLEGNNSINIIKGGDGNDTLRDSTGGDTLEGQVGNDTFTLSGGGTNADGGADNDIFDIISGGNTVIGGIGDDTAIVDFANTVGFSETNTISLGAGDDIVRILNGATFDDLDGGADIDTLDLSMLTTNTTSLQTLNLNTVSSQFAYGGFLTLSGFENILGSDLRESFMGTADANMMSGGGGSDILRGEGGNDVLNGGTGADRLIGGTGIDRAQYSNAAASVRADLQLSGTNTGEAAGDIYTSIENLYGSTHDDLLLGDGGGNRIWGDSGNDRMFGRSGNDVLFGMNGDDVLIGGAGVDTLVGGNDDDILNGGTGADKMNGGSGVDMAQYTGATAALRADLQLSGTNTGEAAGDTYVLIENLYGSAHNDVLLGDGEQNTVWGADGNDKLYGRSGNDVLLGMEGNDALFGGNDNDTLNGGTGADKLDGGTGVDRAQYTTATAGVRADLQLSGTNTGEAAGDTYISIENLQGSAHNDVLLGDSNSNTLLGANGNDRIFGRDGDDVLFGMKGNDVLVGGTGADIFVFQTGGNSDLITDFEDGTDIIRVLTAGISTFADLTITDAAGGAIVDYGSGTVQVKNIAEALLTTDDFLFV